jgi:hypothetical protein
MSNWIKKLTNKVLGPTPPDPMRLLALSLLPNDVERNGLEKYLNEHPLLANKLRSHTHLLESTDEEFIRWSLAVVFTNYALDRASKKNFQMYEAATGALFFAIYFFEEYPIAWACNAEINVILENSIAARWAKKLIAFKPSKKKLAFYDKVLPDGHYQAMMTQQRTRMKEIIAICDLHPNWIDSYSFLCGIDYYQKLLGKYN